MKIKNIIKKITALSLALTLSFSISIPSHANNAIEGKNNTNLHIINEVTNDNGDVVNQVVEHDGIRYLYENNEEYTKSTMIKNDKVTAAIKYHNEPDYVYIEDMTNGTIEKFEITEFLQVSPRSIQTSSTEEKVARDIEARFGQPYFNRALFTFNTDGRTVKINETYYYQHYKDLDYLLVGQMAIHLASAILSIKTSVFISLASSALTIKDGFMIALNPTKLVVYHLNLVYDRVCSVNSMNVYRAGKTEFWRVITADTGGTGFDYIGVNKDFDFDDIQALRNTAVQIYKERFE